MIIGNGLIAQSFIRYFGDDSNVIVFASGVSNSREFHSEVFLRERHMLVEALNTQQKLLYFSTCSIDDPELQNTPYVMHKKKMEALVCSVRGCYVFRLPQVVGRTPNPNTLTNYLCRQIMSGDSFQVWRHANRNLIDVDDVALIVSYLVRTSVGNGAAINIASQFSIAIPQLVSVFESVLGKKANYTIIDAGGSYSIDSSLATEAASQLGIHFDAAYVENLIRKYYGE
jgi:nucleoside-diphosphate-sugar epimerase